MVALRQSEVIVEGLAHGSYGAIGDHGEIGLDVHAGHEARIRIAGLVHALVHQPNAHHPVLFDQWLVDGGSGPELHQARCHQLGSHPLVELPDREDEPVVFLQEIGYVGEFNGLVLHHSDRTGQAVCQPEAHGTAAGADGVQEVGDLLRSDRMGQRYLAYIEVGVALFEGSCPRDDAGYAKPDVIRPLVAEHLRRHAGHGLALHDRGAVLVHEFA